MLDRRTFLRTTAAAALPAAASQQRSSSGKKPNLLVILADDMGFSDARCYGGDIDTPNIDRLANNGLRFTQGYSTARCGPSRGSLMSGYYAQQTAGDVMTPGNIPEWTRYAPHYLKPLGYRTYHAGKWHIRFKPCHGAGFHHSYWLQDQNRFFTPTSHFLDDKPLPPVKSVEEGFYGTINIADHAVRMLKDHAKDHASDPFFLYLAFTSPHFPLHALQKDIDRYKDRFREGWDVNRHLRWERMRSMGLVKTDLPPLDTAIYPPWNTSDAELAEKVGPGEVPRAVPWDTLTPVQKEFQRTKMAIHAAMITRMDTEIGRVLDQLKAMNATDDTLILFLSDNGASAEIMIRADGHDAKAAPGSAASHLCLGPGWSSAANAPFRLHKSWVHEGGISSPWIAHWPNGIKDKGKLRHNPCHFVDVVPTLIELAGGTAKGSDGAGAPPFAGRSIASVFQKDYSAPKDFIYFHHNNNRAIRTGDWKAVSIGKDGPWELYNIKENRSETKNLATAQPARLARMTALWQQTEDHFVKTREAAKPMPKDRI